MSRAVGDLELFGSRLWWDYNQLKHAPAHEVNYDMVHVITIAARLMLIAELLNKVAGSTVPWGAGCSALLAGPRLGLGMRPGVTIKIISSEHKYAI